MILDKTRIIESNEANMQYVGQTTMNELRCATFAKVTSVNTQKKMLNCQPLVKEKIRANNDDGFIYISLPEFINVPYFTGGSAPRVGDFCVCIHLDRSITELLNADTDNISSINCNDNRHNITDCVAIVGFLR